MDINQIRAIFNKKPYIIWKMAKIENGRRLFEKVYISTKNGKPILKKYTNIFESHYQWL